MNFSRKAVDCYDIIEASRLSFTKRVKHGLAVTSIVARTIYDKVVRRRPALYTSEVYMI